MNEHAIATARHAQEFRANAGCDYSLADAFDPEYLDTEEYVGEQDVTAGMSAKEYGEFQSQMFDYFNG